MFSVDQKWTYAIIGASADQDKFGYKVLFDLLDNGFNALAINPKGGFIEDVAVYPSLEDVPKPVDVVVFVVPPPVTEKVLLKVKELGIDKVWMQPGSSSLDAVSFCEKNDIDCIHDVCVMVSRQRESKY
ncbi:MAG: CoA-binding protein [Nanoarchaeota archaeon]|nr:CoA-binding protein [Nanoarchaeota archaeon]